MKPHNLEVIKDCDYSFSFVLQTLTDPTLPYDPITNPKIGLDLNGAAATYLAGYDFSTPLISLNQTNGIHIDVTTSTVTLHLNAGLNFDDPQLILNSQLTLKTGGHDIAIVYGYLTIYNSLN